ncbi:4-hydroxybenzoate polyprenyltransferase, mitochondrial-like [Ptychodera flava]|uniref:4-hydroxybenzoate polyprenyltransferase, mitochondrial-like n=1 Tax=Ptychodera flava TaxID=63121 RepID=UPI003969EE89
MTAVTGRTLSSILNRLPPTTCYVVQLQSYHNGRGRNDRVSGPDTIVRSTNLPLLADRATTSPQATRNPLVCQQRSLMKHSPQRKDSEVLKVSWEFTQWKRKLTAAAMVNSAPSLTQPYLKLMRVDKPIGSWLYYWPYAWSLGMAAAPGSLPDPYLLGLFGVAAVVIRGAGCCINDMMDRDFDKHVERCRNRPLASGQVTMAQAGAFLGLQTATALAILGSLNNYTLGLGVIHMFFIATYPLMKRVTYWPQLYLGVVMNAGVLLGWSALHGSCDWSVVLPLLASGTGWTLLYDTIYAHQDKKDDIKIGVKSSALKLADNTKLALSGFAGVMVSGMAVAGIANEQALPYYIGVAATAAHLARQIYTVDLDNPKDCWNKFDSNKYLGIIIFLAIMAGTYCKKFKKEEVTGENVYY